MYTVGGFPLIYMSTALGVLGVCVCVCIYIRGTLQREELKTTTKKIKNQLETLRSFCHLKTMTKKIKDINHSSPKPISCPSAVYSPESPPIPHRSLNNHPRRLFSSHLIRFGGVPEPGARSGSSYQSELKELKHSSS